MTFEKILLKPENLFDSYADAIVLPRSTIGTINEGIRSGALNHLKIELPEKLPYKPLGTLDVTRHTNLRENNLKPIFFILMATCVDNNMSTYESIRVIMSEIARFTRENPEIRDVALPLIGTGAGGLDYTNVYEILSTTFIKESSEESRLYIYIPDNNIYSKVKTREKELLTDFEESQKLRRRPFDSNFFDTNLSERQIYLAGSSWDGVDQADRFFKNDIWENGYDNRFISLIQNIKPGSIIVLKSTYANSNTGYLRIKGAGFVTENLGDGRRLGVNWRVKNYNSDIPAKSGYRNTITEIGESVFIDIIKALKYGDGFLEQLFGSDENLDLRFQGVSKIAILAGDSDDGIDQLDIRRDVLAFAKLMAAKTFKPPLAIALFGQWGSGKSFFMRKLMDRIDLLSGISDKNLYCKGIAQIHFNAWSYLDANLWASIVSRIFEKLYEYIGNDSATEDEKNKIRKELADKLKVVNEEVALIEQQKNEVQSKIESLEAQKAELKTKLENEKNAIGKASLYEVLDKVDNEFEMQQKIKAAIQSNASLNWDREQLELILPKEYLDDPDQAYRQMKSITSFLKTFFAKKNLWSNIICIFLIVLGIIWIPLLIKQFTDWLKNADFIIPSLQWTASLVVIFGPTWKRFRETYKKWSPMVATFWKIKTEYDKKVQNALFEQEQKEKQLTLDIESSQKELISIEQNLQQSQKIINDLDFKMKHALATEALYGFIEKRCKSEDYRKHLGIISVIQKDFDTLSDYFVGHQEEYKVFRRHFNKPLERIILYIDDLDRCPEDRVVEVLEAVNLLMAFPLFIVVVGVDPRWVKNALTKKYTTQFGDKKSDKISAMNYLEKIFQIPFHLRPASDANVKSMIKALTEPIESLPAIESEEDIPSENEFDFTASFQPQETRENIPSETEVVDMDFVVLSKKESDFMQQMSTVVGNNPRAVKRYVNIYQIVRAHEDFTYSRSNEDRELLVILFLLALLNGKFRSLSKNFLDFVYTITNQSKLLSEYFEYEPTDDPDEDIRVSKNRLDMKLIEHPHYRELLAVEMNTFINHHQFIQRFTFDEE